MILTIILVVLLFSALIVIHELGHFWAAKRAGVKVEEFGLGLPPKIFGVQKGETLYSLNAIPFGGFVRMAGESGPTGAKAKGHGRDFADQSLPSQAFIVSAGVLMNLLLAFVLLTAGYIFGMQPLLATEEDLNAALKDGTIELSVGVPLEGAEGAAWLVSRLIVSGDESSPLAGQWEEGSVLEWVGDQQVFTEADLIAAFDARLAAGAEVVDLQGVSPKGEIIWIKNFPIPFHPPLLTGVEPGSPAEAAGLMFGDEVLFVDGVSLTRAEQVVALTKTEGADGVLAYTIRRDGEEMDLTIPLREDGRIGVALADRMKDYGGLALYEMPIPHALVAIHPVHYGVKAPVVALKEMWRLGSLTAVMFVSVLGDFLSGDALPAEVSGPVGIAHMAAQSVNEGFSSVLRLMAMLSLSLGVINILPIPALDGGRLFFILFQMLTGRAPRPKAEAFIHGAGFILLILFLLAVTFKDVTTLF